MNAEQDFPGLRRMRPDDHFMVLSETDASPMHVGALLMLAVRRGERAGFAERFRTHLAERLPATPLLARLVPSPEGFDSDVWAEIAEADLERHVVREPSPEDEAALHAAVARLNMVRLDLAHPPFMAHVFDALPGDAVAVYLKMHHAVADGIGFQSVLGLLSDQTPPQDARVADAPLPDGAAWRAAAEARFEREAPLRAAHSERRKTALAALEPLKRERAQTPEFALSGETSNARAYTTLTVPLAPFRQTAKALQATVNDLFLACASGALREFLIERGELPEAPLVINSSRSYRKAEHGEFGNRIVAIHPHLATHLADPIERLRAIQKSMAAELRRSPHDEAMLDAPDKPFGARDRRAMFAERTAGGRRLLPGNLSLSNVPGPAEPRRYMGYPALHNYPVPIIGSGRFLNITSRRSGDNLDMGVIVDAAKIADPAPIARGFERALQHYERLARSPSE